MNKFIGYSRGFDSIKGFAPEFKFDTYDELLDNKFIKELVGYPSDDYQFKMLRQKRSWLSQKGKVSTTFFSVILESNSGKRWMMIGRCEQDVKEMKEWDK